MKRNFVVSVLLACLSFNVAWAADASCDAKAAEEKLAGAAKNAFVKKCEKDALSASPVAAATSCENKAAEKKLAGAAKNSFVKKCEKEATPAK